MKLIPPMRPKIMLATTMPMPSSSTTCGIRCRPMSPLAVSPQTKNPELKSQKVELRKASRMGVADTAGSGRTAPEAAAISSWP